MRLPERLLAATHRRLAPTTARTKSKRPRFMRRSAGPPGGDLAGPGPGPACPVQEVAEVSAQADDGDEVPGRHVSRVPGDRDSDVSHGPAPPSAPRRAAPPAGRALRPWLDPPAGPPGGGRPSDRRR